MPTMPTLNRDFCRTLSTEIETALKAIADKHDLNLQMTGGAFNFSSYRPKIEFSTKEESGIPSTWSRHCFSMDLKPEDFGKTFIHGGTEFQITGLDLKKHKYPILVTRLRDGKKFLYTADDIRSKLGVTYTCPGH